MYMSDEIIINQNTTDPLLKNTDSTTEVVPEENIIPEEPTEVITEEVVAPAEPIQEDILETETFNESTPEKIEVAVSTEPTPVSIPSINTQENIPTTVIALPEIPKETPPREISQTEKENIIREFLSSIMNKARAATQTKKKKNLELTMALFDTRMSITNDLVEKTLKISDSSARTYLNRLEKDGKILQHGTKGRGVFYTKL